MKRKNSEVDVEATIVSLLDQCFGDGQVYLDGGDDWVAFERALQLGLVSDDGCLTAEGKRFSLRYQ